MKTNIWNSSSTTSSCASLLRQTHFGAGIGLLSLCFILAVGCDTGGPTAQNEDNGFNIDRIGVTIHPTLVHEHPSFEITVENQLEWGLDEVMVNMSFWAEETQIANTPMPFTAPISSGLKAQRTFPVITIDPSLITTHEDYQCYRYEVRAEDERGNYETKNYEGTCS